MKKLLVILASLLFSTSLCFANSLQQKLLETPSVKSFISGINTSQTTLLRTTPSINTQQSFSHVSFVLDSVLNIFANMDYKWVCNHTVSTLAQGIKHYTFTCNGQWPGELPGFIHKNKGITNLKVNVITADTGSKQMWSVKPVITGEVSAENKTCTLDSTKNPKCMQPLVTFASQYNHMHKNQSLIAAINGSYFFIAHNGFFDSNCLWKTIPGITHDFSKPSEVSFLLDGLTVEAAKKYASNCATFKLKALSPARATFVVNKENSMLIQNMPSGDVPISSDIVSALGAGPMMIQNSQYAMEWQAIPSTFEFSANTAVALAKTSAKSHTNKQQKLLFFTVDGNDKNAGMYSFEMANLLKTAIAKALGTTIISAMSMDQGKSTTMITCKGAKCSQVSNSGAGNPGRTVYNGLALFAASSAKTSTK